MKSIFDTPISCYRNVKDNVGTVTTLRDFLFCDQYMERIKNIRTLADEARQKSLKTELPQATISGTFAPTRKAENLVTHSRLLCVDIDKQDNNDTGWLDDLKYEWCHIPQILYAARRYVEKVGSSFFALINLRNTRSISKLCAVISLTRALS
jgi:hypothetical protein